MCSLNVAIHVQWVARTNVRFVRSVPPLSASKSLIVTSPLENFEGEAGNIKRSIDFCRYDLAICWNSRSAERGRLGCHGQPDLLQASRDRILVFERC